MRITLVRTTPLPLCRNFIIRQSCDVNKSWVLLVNSTGEVSLLISIGGGFLIKIPEFDDATD